MDTTLISKYIISLIKSFTQSNDTSVKFIKELQLPKTLKSIQEITELVCIDHNDIIAQHQILGKLLSDQECVEQITEDFNESTLWTEFPKTLVIKMELLACYIEIVTQYNVEILISYCDNTEVFVQLDENTQKFYFTFFHDHIEYGYDKEDFSKKWDEYDELVDIVQTHDKILAEGLKCVKEL